MSSSLPGGPASKAGLVYETFYGIRAMLSILLGTANAIKIEPLREDGCEFWVDTGDTREYWQVKRQLIDQSWTLHKMHQEGVLAYFLEKIRGGNVCIFASMTDASELRLLAEHAVNADGALEEFKSKFLNEKQKDLFQKLIAFWDNISEAEAFAALGKIQFEGHQERSLEKDLEDMFKALFGVPSSAYNCLYEYYQRSVHQRLDRHQILAHLASNGVQLRIGDIIESDIRLLHEITDTYIAGQQKKLIAGRAIPQPLAQQIVEKIIRSQCSLDLAIASEAGAGKSACLLQIVEQLRLANIPVLAFRLDARTPCATSTQLGQQLGLRESPAVLFSRAFVAQPAVIIIDQLDVVSAASGRHPDFFDTVAKVVDEIRGCRINSRLHLVIACREFDLSHDPRLRRLFEGNDWSHHLSRFSAEQVSSVIAGQGGNFQSLTKAQRDLLLLSQNLYLFIESGLATKPNVQFNSHKQLLDLFWKTKATELIKSHAQSFSDLNGLIQKLSTEMSNTQQLSVPLSRLPEFAPPLINSACSVGILVNDDKRISFQHESLFDYVFAKTQIAQQGDFATFLEEDAQLLFRRGQLRQVLVFLREDDSTSYLRTLKRLIHSPKIRFHLKLLALQLVAAFRDISDDEFRLFLPFIEKDFECRRTNAKNPDALCRHGVEQFFQSEDLFLAADRLGYLKKWLNTGESWLCDFLLRYFHRQISKHPDRIAELLQPFEDDPGWQDRFKYLLQWAALDFCELENGRSLFDLFLKMVDRGTLDEARGLASNGDFFSMFHGLGKRKPDVFSEMATHWLLRQLQRGTARQNEEGLDVSLNGSSHSDDMLDSAKSNPKAFLTNVLPAVLRVAEASLRIGERIYKADSVWYWRHIDDHISISESYLQGCEAALEGLAVINVQEVRPILETLKETKALLRNKCSKFVLDGIKEVDA